MASCVHARKKERHELVQNFLLRDPVRLPAVFVLVRQVLELVLLVHVDLQEILLIGRARFLQAFLYGEGQEVAEVLGLLFEFRVGWGEVQAGRQLAQYAGGNEVDECA